MATVQELLNRYNKIAARPLKSWKESREKLEKRLDRLMSIPRVEPVKTPEEAAPVGKEETRKTQPMNDHIREIIVKNPGGWRKDLSSAGIKPPYVFTKPAEKPSGIPAFCADHGINPKIARAALRKAGFSAPYDLNAVRDVILAIKK
jgi:hypothetical protein